MKRKKRLVVCFVFLSFLSLALVPFSEAATGWSKTYPAKGYPFAGVIQTSDGGYALAGIVGQTKQGGGGNADAWLAKTNSSGDIEWSKTYGGTKDDVVYSAVQTSDGGYAL
jgi:hypothetical protein